ncbi:hypothetical protein DBR11_24600, partial [Pedobacter sp. HMWF019]|uniref:hypothetical protein n=1 Tax=Pedobacter sp. HMWF019 TaxID=2056856 RepID=UPI000D3AD532
MPENYQVKVFAAYEEKLANGDLPLLKNATTARLKNACLKIYDNRYKPEDDDIFSEFFDLDKVGVNFREKISDAKTGVFRPLLNHLKGETTTTHNRNSELLAWLIDFQPRPSIAYYKSFHSIPLVDDDPPPNEYDGPPVSDEDQDDGPGENDFPPPNNNEGLNKKIATGLLILLISGGTISLFSTNVIGTDYHEPLPNEKCMVWKSDRYEPIPCDINLNDRIILPLDKEQLAHQRKITQPDTLTTNSLGKVWYTKINGTPEFYTDSGMHPADTLRRLKPLTNYILTKYVSYY